ncbi:MAG: flavodoxin family protein [Promethearchaeota archaeon]
MLTILAINGSPKKQKSGTEWLLNLALEGTKTANVKDDIHTEILHLRDYIIQDCNGCNLCVTKKICPLSDDDDYPLIEQKMLKANALILGGPTYWAGVPSIMRRWMDRSRVLKMKNHQLSEKIVGFLTSAGLRHGGQEAALMSMMLFSLGQGMIIVGVCDDPIRYSPFPVGSLQHDLEGEFKFRGIPKDPIASETAKLLGKRIAEVSYTFSKNRK